MKSKIVNVVATAALDQEVYLDEIFEFCYNHIFNFCVTCASVLDLQKNCFAYKVTFQNSIQAQLSAFSLLKENQKHLITDIFVTIEF